MRTALKPVGAVSAGVRNIAASAVIAIVSATMVATASSSAAADSASAPRVTLREIAKLDHPEALGVAWSPDGRYLATVGLIGARSTRSKPVPNSVSLWDMNTYRMIRSVYRILGGGNSLAFTADSAHVFFALPGDQTKIALDPAMPEGTAFVLWNVSNGVIDRYVPSPISKGVPYGAHAATIITLSPDGRHLAAVYGTPIGKSKPIGIYDAKSLELISQENKIERSGVSAMAFSPDGRHLAIGQYNGEIRIVDFMAAKTVLAFRAHAPSVRTLAYSPDGKRLLSGAGMPGSRRDETAGRMVEYLDHDPIRVWDASTGQRVHSYGGKQSGEIPAVAWSPDGRYIASASDSTVRLWAARSPQLLNEVARFRPVALTVAFDPTGRRLAAGGTQEIVIVEINEGKK